VRRRRHPKIQATKRPTMEARLPDLLLLPLRRSQPSPQLRLFSYELL
jgi:hypothetical protein